jgi:heterogeneous nuclear ribonucleoprotein G
MDDRYDGGRYGDRDRLDTRDYKYSGRDRYASDRYKQFNFVTEMSKYI